MEFVSKINASLNAFVWGIPMLLLIMGTGVYFTLRTGWLQFGRFPLVMKKIFQSFRPQSTRDKGAVSPFQAVSTALAATLGTGNIAGVAGAIALGGPGAVFWMWISALFGMATKYAEVLLAIRFRKRNEKGEWVGGPMYYITRGLGEQWRWLAVLFSCFGAIAAFGIGNMAQMNTISTALMSLLTSFHPDPSAVAASAPGIKLTAGILVALVSALVILGGVRRIGEITEKLIPLMSALYLVGAFVVIFVNIDKLLPVLSMIVEGAFRPEAVTGGAAISMLLSMQRGIGRGVFSNEAGMGSAPIAHAAANTKSPVEQGFFGIFEVFADTIVICTVTALVILMGLSDISYGENAGAELTVRAFATVFTDKGASAIVAVGILFFAVATIFSWSLYGTRCCEFLLGPRSTKPYQLLFLGFTVLGATMEMGLVWEIADTLNGLMSIPNLIAILALSGTVAQLTREYFYGRRPTRPRRVVVLFPKRR